MGSNPVTGILDGSGVKAPQVWLIHPALFFLDAWNDCWTNQVSFCITGLVVFRSRSIYDLKAIEQKFLHLKAL